MKCIFKIEEYLPDTNQIVVRFARLHSPQHIDNYKAVAIDATVLDFYDYNSFIESLMMNYGDSRSSTSEIKDPIVNDIEEVNIDTKFDVRDLIGKVIESESDNYRRSILKMRKVDL
tara:strand:+ start:193 stop:540 length:348 start_codon:yes stop_codon:yes gene_type:complete